MCVWRRVKKGDGLCFFLVSFRKKQNEQISGVFFLFFTCTLVLFSCEKPSDILWKKDVDMPTTVPHIHMYREGCIHDSGSGTHKRCRGMAQ